MFQYVALVDGKPGAYGVVFPDLPGCTAMGETMDIALANAVKALRDWIEVMKEHGAKVPSPLTIAATVTIDGGNIDAVFR